jgi:glycosyltransferase involved in cell wall biosynthesis
MKIAFLLRLDTSKESGVLKKVASQLKIWKEFGHEVKLFAQTPSLNHWKGLDGINIEAVESDESPNVKGVRKIVTRFKSMDALMKGLDLWQPDVVFYRFTTYYPSVSSSMMKHRYILEINTDDVEEYKTRFGKLKNLYHRTFRKKILEKAKGMVFVTNELMHKFSDFNCQKTVVSNSINFDEYNTINAPNNTKPHIIFIGTPGRKWHGFEKLVELGRIRPNYIIDLVGPDEKDYLEIPENVNLHGYLRMDEYIHLIQRADVAFGTVSLHEKNMQEACPLKVREYLAFGIPTIIPYEDTDFTNTRNEMVLQIPNNNNNIIESLSQIDHFIKKCIGKRVDRSTIGQLDAKVKERERIIFIKKVIALE